MEPSAKGQSSFGYFFLVNLSELMDQVDVVIPLVFFFSENERILNNLTTLPAGTLQGDVPWDEKDFRYLAVTAAGLGSVLLYLYFRDNGREISWKDFVHRYISRGVVRSGRAAEGLECESHGSERGAESMRVSPGGPAGGRQQAVRPGHPGAGSRR